MNCQATRGPIGGSREMHHRVWTRYQSTENYAPRHAARQTIGKVDYRIANKRSPLNIVGSFERWTPL
ncbi:hypothetical protein ANTRET_LOCUS1730 [Anthophora retusa]